MMRGPAALPRFRSAAALMVAAAAMAAHGATGTSTGLGNPATADLRFTVRIDRFLFFRVGTAAWPTVSSTVNTVAFSLTPSVPGGPASPVAGSNNAPATWDTGVPPFTASPVGSATLPVEVRSNGGTVSLRASVSAALSNGAYTLPMSAINISSDQSTLPAPPVPASGTGSTVAVTGSSQGGLVTQRSATWTFDYTGSSVPMAGSYAGQITFTASTP